MRLRSPVPLTWQAALPVAVIVGLSGIMLIALADGSARAIAVTLFLVLGIALAFASGNPRLFCLWGLMVTLSLNLSKHFGEILNKGGGETSLRIEVSDPFLIVLAIFLARDLWTGLVPGLRIPKVTFLWLAIAAMGIATIIEGPWRTTAAHEVIRMVKMTVLFVVIANELRTPTRVLHCVGGLVLGMFGQSIIGVLQFARGANLGLEILGETATETIEILAKTSLQSERVWRVSGLLLHPNLFGIYLAALIPLAAAATLLRIRPWMKLFFFLVAGLSVVALIATYSRSSWASFGAAILVLGVLMLRHPKFRMRTRKATLVILVTMTAVGITFFDQMTTRLFESKADATVGRAQFEEDALRMISEKPWMGWGLNSYVHEVVPFLEHPVEAYSGWVPPVHNIYLLWWAETGLIGLLVHLAMWSAIVATAIRNFKTSDEIMYAVNAACLAGMTAFSVDGFLSFTLRVNQPLRVFWVLAGIIMAVRYWRLDQLANRASRADE